MTIYGEECERALRATIIRGDKEGKTVREYLKSLLVQLWILGESFSGKRPFGNSGWESDLIFSLVVCKFIPGHISYYDDGEFEDADYDSEQANKYILKLIEYCFEH